MVPIMQVKSKKSLEIETLKGLLDIALKVPPAAT